MTTDGGAYTVANNGNSSNVTQSPPAPGSTNTNTVTPPSSLQAAVDPTNSSIANMKAVSSNPLNSFKSYDCLFTLACLSKSQQNSANFNTNNINNILATSRGNWGNSGSRRVQTDFGSFDYFIDDVVIASIPTVSEKTGNTLATKITFKITEPYSMGLFLIAMQQGAGRAGYTTNFQQAPYILIIEFAGYVNDTPSQTNIARYLPLIFIDVKMRVTSSGCTYDCECVPYNEVGFRDQYTTAPADLKVSGSDVKTMILNGENSLLTAMKKKFQLDFTSKEITVTDSIDIQFPSSQTDTGNGGNAISESKIFDNLDTAGLPSFPSHDAVFDPKKQIYKQDVVKSVDKTNVVFNFRQNIKIQDVITEIVIRSDYIVKQLTNADVVRDPKGMINWFRIETQVLDGPESPQLGRQTRKTIYRVLPFQVHMSKFLPPGGIPPGYPQITETVNRVYNYLYTGQNTEVLGIDLNFDMAFFSSVPSDLGSKTGESNPNQAGLSAGQTRPKTTISSETLAYTTPGVGFTAANQPQSQEGIQYRAAGGGGADLPATAQVRTYQALLENPSDLVNIEMTIMGDPYYLPSSGMGNQMIESVSDNLLKDGSMNYQSGELDIVLNFRTPIDFDPVTGLYKFVIKIDQYSGLYFITEVESRFNHNKFTQIIKATRRRSQVSGSNQANTIFGQG